MRLLNPASERGNSVLKVPTRTFVCVEKHPEHAAALDRVRVYVAARDRQPLRGLGNVIHAVHVGENGGELRLSDLRALLAAAGVDADAREGGGAVICQTCKGNGEVVVDWDRYLHPALDDPQDAGVAECPDCDGTGEAGVLQGEGLGEEVPPGDMPRHRAEVEAAIDDLNAALRSRRLRGVDGDAHKGGTT